jgi:flagellar protein FlaG
MDIKSIGNAAPAAPPVTSASEHSAPAAKAPAAPLETAAAVQQAADVPSMAQLTQAVQKLNKAMASMSQGLEFSIDSESHRTIVKVIDQKTKDVIRQIPTEETLQIANAITDAIDQAQGLLISQKA